jgi:hypothetical protein
LEPVILTEFQATEAYFSLDLIKAKYSISRQSTMEAEEVIALNNPSNLIACDKRNLRNDENGVYNQYVHPDP